MNITGGLVLPVSAVPVLPLTVRSGYAERIWELMSVAKELGKDTHGAAAAQQALLARAGPSRGVPALPSTSSAGSSAPEGADGALVPLLSNPSAGSEVGNSGEFREAKYIEFQDVTVSHTRFAPL